MESNMKKIFQYMTTLLLLLVVGTSCEEGNDNWRIITDAQPGAYITGDATIYSATATSSQLVAAPVGWSSGRYKCSGDLHLVEVKRKFYYSECR